MNEVKELYNPSGQECWVSLTWLCESEYEARKQATQLRKQATQLGDAAGAVIGTVTSIVSPVQEEVEEVL